VLLTNELCGCGDTGLHWFRGLARGRESEFSNFCRFFDLSLKQHLSELALQLHGFVKTLGGQHSLCCRNSVLEEFARIRKNFAVDDFNAFAGGCCRLQQCLGIVFAEGQKLIICFNCLLETVLIASVPVNAAASIAASLLWVDFLLAIFGSSSALLQCNKAYLDVRRENVNAYCAVHK